MSNNAVDGIVESGEACAADEACPLEGGQGACPLLIIMRQTDYTKETAETKLLEHKGDVIKVIREYINPTGKTGLITPTKLSTNQRVYKEIRGMMDDACRTYELNKQNS
jgi:hypothetical protein